MCLLLFQTFMITSLHYFLNIAIPRKSHLEEAFQLIRQVRPHNNHRVNVSPTLFIKVNIRLVNPPSPQAIENLPPMSVRGNNDNFLLAAWLAPVEDWNESSVGRLVDED